MWDINCHLLIFTIKNEGVHLGEKDPTQYTIIVQHLLQIAQSIEKISIYLVFLSNNLLFQP